MTCFAPGVKYGERIAYIKFNTKKIYRVEEEMYKLYEFQHYIDILI